MRLLGALVVLAMILPPSAVETLRELSLRRPASAETKQRDAEIEVADAARLLRSIYYPKAAAFFTSTTSKWKATRKTRRAGITTQGCREMIALALETPGFRAMYVGSTRIEAKDRAWKSDTKSGLVDVLEKLAESVDHPTVPAFRIGGVVIEVREGDLTLTFSNGSEIELFGADNIRSHRKKRGGAKHLVWIDEAQDFLELEKFFDNVIMAALDDFKGECWVTGTPGEDCAGMFYEITKEPDGGDDDPPMQGWDVHELAQVDNPFFGHVVTDATEPGGVAYFVEDNSKPPRRTGPFATGDEAEQAAIAVRWEQTAADALRKKGWTPDEPAFKREYLGKWVKATARYVYPIHGVPKHVLLFAPQRLADNPFVGTHPRFAKHGPWYDHQASLLDLPRPPRGQRPYSWMFALWADFGYSPDPFALGANAFCYELPDVWEMFSWKQTLVATDDQGAYLKLLWDAIPEIVSFVGDPAGKQDDFAVWQERMNLPIEEANKRGKSTLEAFLADDVRIGRFHPRTNSPLHNEMKHLVYKPTMPGKTREVDKHRKVAGVVHGDHCCDGVRYSYADLRHWISKKRDPKPEPGTAADYKQDEEREQRAIEDADTRRARALAEGDEVAAEYGGGYQW